MAFIFSLQQSTAGHMVDNITLTNVTIANFKIGIVVDGLEEHIVLLSFILSTETRVKASKLYF